MLVYVRIFLKDSKILKLNKLLIKTIRYNFNVTLTKNLSKYQILFKAKKKKKNTSYLTNRSIRHKIKLKIVKTSHKHLQLLGHLGFIYKIKFLIIKLINFIGNKILRNNN